MLSIYELGIKILCDDFTYVNTLFHTRILAAEAFLRKSITPNLRSASFICYVTPMWNKIIFNRQNSLGTPPLTL